MLQKHYRPIMLDKKSLVITPLLKRNRELNNNFNVMGISGIPRDWNDPSGGGCNKTAGTGPERLAQEAKRA